MTDAARSDRRLVGWLGFVAGFAAIAYGGRLAGGRPPEDALYRYELAAGAALQFGLMLAIVLAIAFRAPKRELFALRAPRSWPVALGLAFAIYVGVLALAAVVGLVLDPGGEQGLLPETWRPERILPLALNALSVVVLAPIVEEVTFRGLGYSLLERFGARLAVVAVGVAFALAHGLVESFPVLAALGIGLALLRRWTASIYPCILLHATFNALALAFALYTAAN